MAAGCVGGRKLPVARDVRRRERSVAEGEGEGADSANHVLYTISSRIKGQEEEEEEAANGSN